MSTEPGCQITNDGSSEQASIAHAAALAATADATVLTVGLDGSLEGEGHDRFSIEFPGNQSTLIEAVSTAAKGPVIVVFIGGGCVDMSAIKASPHVHAIIIAGYPGQEGGNAIAQTIYGDNNPAGRLTQTWYEKQFISQCSMFDMQMRPNATTGCPGRTHRFYTGTPVFKFGEGMSYSSFEYTEVSLDGGSDDDPSPSLSLNDLSAQIAAHQNRPHLAPAVLHLAVGVTNTGQRDGDEVVLLYAVPPAGLESAPLQNLRGYQRVHLRAGESTSLHFELTSHDLAFGQADGTMGTAAGEWQLRVGSANATKLHVVV